MIPWIKSQAERILGRSENVYYKKLKRILRHQHKINQYTHVYFLGGFEYNEENHETYKKTDVTFLRDFLLSVRYNAQVDNVEIYCIKNAATGSNYLLALLDPVELYSSEQILDIRTSPDINLEGLNYEQIFPTPKKSWR